MQRVPELALLGRAYELREDYYLGWFGDLMDNPFRIQDDIERTGELLPAWAGEQSVPGRGCDSPGRGEGCWFARSGRRGHARPGGDPDRARW